MSPAAIARRRGSDVDDVFAKIDQAGLQLVTIDAAGAVA